MNYTKQELLDFIDEELSLINDGIMNYDGYENGPMMKCLRMQEDKLKEIRAYISNWEPKE